MMNPGTLEAVKNVFDTEAECILGMKERLDEKAVEEAVRLIIEAPRTGTCGSGHSGIVCRHFAHLLCCCGQPARFIAPSEAVHGAAGFLQKGDVMVLASRGGKTAELLPVLEVCRKRGVHVITVTENTGSPLAAGAEVVLRMYVNRETDRDNTQGTTSSTALAVMFHVIQTAIIEETGWGAEDFAEIHPGGAVGERLCTFQSILP